MDTPPYESSPGPPPFPGEQSPRQPNKLKQAFGPLAVLGVLLAKFKGLLFALLKFFPFVLKTGGTMFLTIWVYAVAWGWRFAVGFVLLIFVHECGHLVAAKRVGLKVGAPVFIPFMGALIALKEAPRNAWIEAQVGIGGPLLGTVGAVVCFVFYQLTGHPIFLGLTYVGFLLNLFNLAPVGFLDGGRIVTALSPWLWLVGIVIIGVLMVTHFNFLLFLIFIFSLPRVFSLFRRKTDEERRYFEVTPAQRWFMAALYFGLVVFLVVGMRITQVRPGA
ncbi:MAG: site-2 protease family protein [Limisphaerales bacterium]